MEHEVYYEEAFRALNEQRGPSASSSSSSWLISLLLTFIVISVGYYFLMSKSQQATRRQPDLLTPEQQREARQKRERFLLGRLEKQQTTNQEDLAEKRAGSADSKSTARAAPIKEEKASKSTISTSPEKASANSTTPHSIPAANDSGIEKATSTDNQSNAGATQGLQSMIHSRESFSRPNKEPETTQGKKGGTKNSKLPSSPRDIFCRAVSTITNLSIMTTAEGKPLNGATIIWKDVSIDASWDDLQKSLKSPECSIFLSLQSVLNTDPFVKHSSYVPVKLNQRRLWKASSWYHGAKTYTRDSAGLDDGTRQLLQSCLDRLAQWVVRTVAEQLRSDFAHRGMDSLLGHKSTYEEEGSDTDVDLGLFADESYGGIAHDTIDLNHGQEELSNQTYETNLMVDDLFTILEDEMCNRALTKSFLGDIAVAYNKATGASSNTPEQSPTTSLGMILLCECLRRLPSPEDKVVLHQNTIQKHLLALENLLVLCNDAVQALAAANIPTSGILPKKGKTWEEMSMLRSLFYLAAHTVPRFASKAMTSDDNFQNRPADDLLPGSFHESFVGAMQEEYPICIYARKGYDSAIMKYHSILHEQRTIMKSARATAALAMKRLAATSLQDNARKGAALFNWFRRIVETNEPLMDILQSDLLSPKSAQASCSSRPFLLGLATGLLHLCGPSLASRLQSDGVDAFDVRYMLTEDARESDRVGIVISSRERPLLEGNNPKGGSNDSEKSQSTRYSGATEFFFLTAALLRLSLFPGFRVHEELSRTYEDTFSMIRTLADRSLTLEELKRIPDYAMATYQKCVTVTLGWTVFNEDPEISTLLTSFALLQLEWVGLCMARKRATLLMIPEWFCKLPAQWIAHVALYTPRLLQPHQGETAVQIVTQLLQAGTAGAKSPSIASQLSPPVLTELIRVAGAFVKAGVDRARAKENARRTNRSTPMYQLESDDAGELDDDFELDLIDDRELDIYTSFDKNDLGVTVFTNNLVSTQLCPTLIRTYFALDAVEGMDVEREHHFDKFIVKDEVADLLLRLWSHPSGDFQRSMVDNIDQWSMARFGSSAVGALGLLLDNACQNLLDIQDTQYAHEQRYGHMQVQPPLSGQDMMYIEHHARSASYGFLQTRRLLMLLCHFSASRDIALLFGGVPDRKEKSGSALVASNFAAMFVHLMDKLTGDDGGTHPEIDFHKIQPEARTARVLAAKKSTTEDLSIYLEDLLFSRRFVLLEFGLDVGIFAHQLLSLAARWHLAASFEQKEGRRCSRFLDAIARNELCNVKQLRNVFTRLVGNSTEMFGREIDNSDHILERDGHVDITNWKEKYNIPGSGPDNSRQRRNMAKQERMTHDKIKFVASLQDIELFLNDLERAVTERVSGKFSGAWGEESMACLEENILGKECRASESVYNEYLDEWVVSSESFMSKLSENNFLHSYDVVARARSLESIGSGKLLVKEAKKCKRVLPSPHPNASVFVCFAEERMDICRAIITGTVDTPYSLGLFEFDILFPSTYPSAPPLLTFKTTGDGQIRVSPNLYNDGKVCISILGTANAWDDSQRWNPANSSLAQVLLSIQTQILGVPDPFFSDGFGHEDVKDTVAGETGSRRYNNKLRLHTLRHAVIAPLKHPPLGFEEVTKRHFVLCRVRVLAQAKRWTLEAKGTPLFYRFTKSYEELATLLSTDEMRKLSVQSYAAGQTPTAIPPNGTDLDALKYLDPVFYRKASTASAEGGIELGDSPPGEGQESENGEHNEALEALDAGFQNLVNMDEAGQGQYAIDDDDGNLYYEQDASVGGPAGQVRYAIDDDGNLYYEQDAPVGAPTGQVRYAIDDDGNLYYEQDTAVDAAAGQVQYAIEDDGNLYYEQNAPVGAPAMSQIESGIQLGTAAADENLYYGEQLVGEARAANDELLYTEESGLDRAYLPVGATPWERNELGHVGDALNRFPQNYNPWAAHDDNQDAITSRTHYSQSDEVDGEDENDFYS